MVSLRRTLDLNMLMLILRRPLASTADSQRKGWGNAFCVSLLMFAFFGYRYAPNFTYGMG